MVLLFSVERVARSMVADKMYHIGRMGIMCAGQHNMLFATAAACHNMMHDRAWAWCRGQGGEGEFGGLKVGNDPFGMSLRLRYGKTCA